MCEACKRGALVLAGAPVSGLEAQVREERDGFYLLWASWWEGKLGRLF